MVRYFQFFEFYEKLVLPVAGEGPISYAFVSQEMMEQELEAALLKVIRASDENDLSEGWQADPSNKEKLRDLIYNLKKNGGNSNNRKPSMPKSHKGFSRGS